MSVTFAPQLDTLGDFRIECVCGEWTHFAVFEDWRDAYRANQDDVMCGCVDEYCAAMWPVVRQVAPGR